MTNSLDMTAFVIPKSDQLNADDLIGGPRTITITRVSASPESAEQPVSIYFDGDDGKPYKPCKSMRRVMIHAWGADASQYVGRSMSLYRDPKVQFGGMQVGGIRISHMSHISGDMTMALTATRAKRAPYTVKPLTMPNAKPDRVVDGVNVLIDRINAAQDHATLDAIIESAEYGKQYAWLSENRTDQAARIDSALTFARNAIQTRPSDADTGDAGGAPTIPAEPEAAGGASIDD